MARLLSTGTWILLSIVLLTQAMGCKDQKEAIQNVQRLTPVPVRDITIEDYFWSPRLAMIENEAIPHQYERLKELGRIDNFRRAAEGSGEFQGPWLGDAHVYKWIEAASYVLARRPDAPFAGAVKETVRIVAAAQRPDGYLNTFFQLKHPDRQWANLGMGCELYCAGHLVQAALAHHGISKDRTLLDAAVKFADLICDTFGEDGRRGAPGYPGIESALVDLYRFTKERRYLDTAEFFLLERGKKPFLFEEETVLEGVPPQDHGPEYFQAHRPFEKFNDVTGHCARVMRLCAGAADLFGETGWSHLDGVLHSLWNSAFDGQVRITGGLGTSCGIKGSFEGSYADIDAQAAALAWSWRMLQLKGKHEFAHAVEQTLHNGMLACLSLDGKRFFPRLPFFSQGDQNRTDALDGAACPSEVTRILASFPRYLYSTSKEGIWIHMYATGTVATKFADLEIDSQFPWMGIVRITVRPKTDKPFALIVRKPNLAGEALTKLNQYEKEIFPRTGGAYAEVNRKWEDGDVLALFFDIPLLPMKSTTLEGRRENKIAFQKGPMMFCMEQIDNDCDEQELDRFVVGRNPRVKEDFYGDLLGGVKKMKVWATFRNDQGGWDNRFLYLIPYFAWNNREPSAMRIWIKQQ